jgi:putative exporter of polyketide antibiotics
MSDPAEEPIPLSKQSQALDPSLPARTTFQEDLVTAGQRRVNLIWEYTQALIAGLVVIANMIVGVYDGITPSDKHPDFPTILSSALFLIVGFYFSRTNHAAIGGVGVKPAQIYSGR